MYPWFNTVPVIQHEPLKKVPKPPSSVIADANQHKNEDYKIRIRNFYRQYSDAFDIGDKKEGKTSIVVDTGDAKSIRQTARQFPLGKRETERIHPTVLEFHPLSKKSMDRQQCT